MSFSLICRVRGLGSLQGKVLLLLRGGRNAGLLSLLLLWSFPLSLDLRSLNDRDWCRDLPASWARTSFDGVCSVVGISSSSIVFPRPLGGGVTTKLRTEMPCRCRSLRFYESPIVSYYSNCNTEGNEPTDGNSHGLSRRLPAPSLSTLLEGCSVSDMAQV